MPGGRGLGDGGCDSEERGRKWDFFLFCLSVGWVMVCKWEDGGRGEVFFFDGEERRGVEGVEGGVGWVFL